MTDYSKMSDADLLKSIQQPDYSKLSDEDLLKAVQSPQAAPEAQGGAAAVVPQLPPQYHAYQSLMKSPAQIAALPQGQGRTVMALPYAAIPGGLAVQAAAGGIAGAVANPDSPVTSGAIGAATGFGGGLVAKGTGAVYDAVGNIIASKTQPAGDAAKQILSRALERDRISPETVSQTTARYPDKEIAVMDAASSNTARLARTVRTLGGTGGEDIDKFLAERQADQHARVLTDIRQSLADGSDAHGLTESLQTQRATTAKPLYDEAFKANQSITSPVIDKILETPAGKQALASARTKMQNDMSLMGVPDAELREQALEAGQDLPKGGVASGLKLRTLDYVKRSFDDQISAAIRAGHNDDVRILRNTRSEFVKALDEADITAQAGPNSTKAAGGLYKQARAAYSGPSQSIDAIDAGGDFLKMRPEEIKAKLTDLAGSDADFFRVGAARALQDRVLKAGDNRDAVERVFGNKNLRTQIETVFGKGSADRFAEAMTAEKNATATNQFVRGGSNTMDKAADIADKNAQIAGDIVEGFVRHGVRGGTAQALKHVGARSNAFFNGMTPEVRNALAGLLVQTGERPLNALAPGGNLPATAVDNWGTAFAPFIGTETVKRLSSP